jgi:hypothetical protein
MTFEIKTSSLQSAVDLVDAFFKGNQREAISSIEKRVIGIEGGVFRSLFPPAKSILISYAPPQISKGQQARSM